MGSNEQPPDQLNEQRATLGCGTLILIALIVIIFTRPGMDDIEKEIEVLSKKIDGLEATISDQKDEIQALREALEKTGLQVPR